jgi:hypothetical protein
MDGPRQNNFFESIDNSNSNTEAGAIINSGNNEAQLQLNDINQRIKKLMDRL